MRFAFPGSDGGILPFCSARELVIDLSLDMKETMFAVLRGIDAIIRVWCPRSFRIDTTVQDLGRYAIATKDVRGILEYKSSSLLWTDLGWNLTPRTRRRQRRVRHWNAMDRSFQRMLYNLLS